MHHADAGRERHAHTDVHRHRDRAGHAQPDDFGVGLAQRESDAVVELSEEVHPPVDPEARARPAGRHLRRPHREGKSRLGSDRQSGRHHPPPRRFARRRRARHLAPGEERSRAASRREGSREGDPIDRNDGAAPVPPCARGRPARHARLPQEHAAGLHRPEHLAARRSDEIRCLLRSREGPQHRKGSAARPVGEASARAPVTRRNRYRQREGDASVGAVGVVRVGGRPATHRRRREEVPGDHGTARVQSVGGPQAPARHRARPGGRVAPPDGRHGPV